MKLRLALLLAAAAVPAAALAQQSQKPVLENTERREGLLPVHVDARGGRVLLQLPRPSADGVAARFIYVTALETGLGSASLGLDRANPSESRLLVFRRVGKKIVAEVENPRFRATGASPDEQQGVRHAFATSVLWTGDVAEDRPDGTILVDVASFLTRDDLNIAQALKEQESAEYRLVPELSVADSGFVKVFPDNIELQARLTFVTTRQGPEVANIVPVAGNASFTVRHSLVRLPEDGFRSRRFDPRAGTFDLPVTDYSQPLGRSVSANLAPRFRLERLDPGAERSRVKEPITFYVDRAAPEPIRTALLDGARWWADAFEAAGLQDAYRVELLPEGADPLDLRYNVINWVNRATRGWAYGIAIMDPRTGEIMAGRVLLEGLRARQDLLIFQALMGAGATGRGGPDDPLAAALARIRQLSAHEVGHALGFGHNFAASSQGRYSVLDYPAPRISIQNGRPSLADAYGAGVGEWDKFVVKWLYGARDEADADRIMREGMAQGLRYVGDNDARPPTASHPQGSLWDDFADPVEELGRMMQVRQLAVARFGPGALPAGEPAAELRRAFVPIWLIHRYQLEAGAKLLGGVDFSYAVTGDNRQARAVPGADQRRALEALLATLRPEALGVPANLLPHLSAGWPGSGERATEIEVMRTAGGPIFDPLVATEVGAALTLANLLQPHRLNRLDLQHQGDASVPAPHQLIDQLLRQVLSVDGLNPAQAAVQRRTATTTILTLARVQRDPALSPTLSLALSERLARLAGELAAPRGAGPHADWSRGLARLLADREALEKAITDPQRLPRIPPGMPIG